MLISNKSCLGKSATLTFDDIKKRHLALHRACIEYRGKLRSVARSLVCEYSRSLSLPADSWKDWQGKVHQYVETGVWDTSGERGFKPVAIAELQPGDDYSLRFVVSTTLDDNPVTGGFTHGIDIMLRYESGIMCVQVGDGQNSMMFYLSQDDGFNEITSAMKRMICLDMDKSVPEQIELE
ncbi:hypothetical protein LSE82_005037 [Salmonella enterica]|nr:hypothetical protein [Salmonella enterica]